ncbi:SAM and SH3 domain-containing protein 1 [Frankliniella fusca]|uniref:SAM and SH3 domain-containing protein 1 n=1 Tax=Frankliniella fusca TaxID=407009 RepID=A0AAE1LKS9_9NEOP|nr:SAM and SH3 domain-containing protein 1 [Frankliniella fusca]
MLYQVKIESRYPPFPLAHATRRRAERSVLTAPFFMPAPDTCSPRGPVFPVAERAPRSRMAPSAAHEAGGGVNATDVIEWLNVTQPEDGGRGGWECSRPRLGHPVALAVAPALEALLANMKLAFMLHVYGIACLFGVLATYTFFSLINLRCETSRV